MGDRTPNLKPERGKTKIVLREHVDHLGERGQVLAVQPGYARNYLLPKGLAFEASLGKVGVAERRQFYSENFLHLMQISN